MLRFRGLDSKFWSEEGLRWEGAWLGREGSGSIPGREDLCSRLS